ncbi:hypothetical protein ACFQV4_14810 [Streptomyces thermocarboxydus]
MADGAVYKTLMSVDTRGSGGYLDGAKKRMRARIYDLAHASFEAAGVARSMLHLEDRGTASSPPWTRASRRSGCSAPGWRRCTSGSGRGTRTWPARSGCASDSTWVR